MADIVMVLLEDIRYDGRVRKEVGTLVRAGHRVELVVADYSNSRSDGADLGVTIHYIPRRIWSSPWRNFLAKLSFNLKATSVIKQLKITHIHCHDLETLLAGIWSKQRTGATLILDAHELIPESMYGLKKLIWNSIEKRCIKKCDRIIIPEKNRINYYKNKYPYIRQPLLLENFPKQSDIPTEKINIFREIYPINESQKIILYTGILRSKRHIEDLIHSMNMCEEEFALVILGNAFKGYEETLREKINQLDLADRIFLHGAVPHTEILRYMASCDIGTAIYANTDLNNYYCASNKLYEYIALEKAIVTNNYPGLLETVQAFNQGVCLAEITPKSLAESYAKAADSNLVKPGTKKYFWDGQEEILLHVYEK